jgi:hypothetical protein
MMPQIAQPQNNVPPELLRNVFTVFGLVALSGMVLGIWWMIYFNRAAVKARFAGETAPSTHQVPLSITIIAWLFVIGGASILLTLLGGYPAIIFGFVIRGWPGQLISVLFSVLGLVSGVGMLKKHPEAHSLAIGYFALGVLNTLSFVAIPGSAARMRSLLDEMGAGRTMLVNFMGTPFVLLMLGNTIVSILLLWLLISRRRAFIEGCSS